MAGKNCPKCKRKGTYNEKFSQCSACRYGYPPERPKELTVGEARDLAVRNLKDSEARRAAAAEEEARATVGTYDPDEPIVREPVLELIEGEPCPTCRKPVGRKKSTERVRKWRSETRSARVSRAEEEQRDGE